MHILFYEQAVYERDIKTIKFYLKKLSTAVMAGRRDNVSTVQRTETKETKILP